MTYYLNEDGAGSLLTEWQPFSSALTITVNNARNGSVLILRNNGKSYTAPIKNGVCEIKHDMRGMCNIVIDCRAKGVKWICDDLFIEEQDGVVIVKGTDMRRIIADMRNTINSLRAELNKTNLKLSDLDAKVTYTVDGHDLI